VDSEDPAPISGVGNPTFVERGVAVLPRFQIERANRTKSRCDLAFGKALLTKLD
jgi:hypothetical protein